MGSWRGVRRGGSLSYRSSPFMRSNCSSGTVAPMSDYTHLNLKEDVDDQGTNFGLAPNLEARFARVPLGLQNSGVTYLRLAPGFRIPWGHTHKQQEEVFVLVHGSARIKLGDEIREMKPWDAVRVPRETTRGFEAGDEGAEFIAIGAPNTGPGDAETIQDWWVD
jgi:mannose-6-phosphate isomerase-like protein (cupin superfamily)